MLFNSKTEPHVRVEFFDLFVVDYDDNDDGESVATGMDYSSATSAVAGMSRAGNVLIELLFVCLFKCKLVLWQAIDLAECRELRRALIS